MWINGEWNTSITMITIGRSFHFREAERVIRSYKSRKPDCDGMRQIGARRVIVDKIISLGVALAPFFSQVITLLQP